MSKYLTKISKTIYDIFYTVINHKFGPPDIVSAVALLLYLSKFLSNYLANFLRVVSNSSLFLSNKLSIIHPCISWIQYLSGNSLNILWNLEVENFKVFILDII